MRRTSRRRGWPEGAIHPTSCRAIALAMAELRGLAVEELAAAYVGQCQRGASAPRSVTLISLFPNHHPREERLMSTTITLRGNPVRVDGDFPGVGAKAPAMT
jgi:hypothetical protein